MLVHVDPADAIGQGRVFHKIKRALGRDDVEEIIGAFNLVRRLLGGCKHGDLVLRPDFDKIVIKRPLDASLLTERFQGLVVIRDTKHGGETGHEFRLDRFASAGFGPPVPRHVEHFLRRTGTLDRSKGLSKHGFALLEALDEVPGGVAGVVRVDAGYLGSKRVGECFRESLDSVPFCTSVCLIIHMVSLQSANERHRQTNSLNLNPGATTR